MPTYVYRCPSCGNQFEFEHGMREKPTVHCPTCGEVAEHVFVPTGVVLKGSGFYNTDYKSDASRTEERRMAKSEDEAKHPGTDKPAGTEGAKSGDAGGAAAAKPKPAASKPAD